MPLSPLSHLYFLSLRHPPYPTPQNKPQSGEAPRWGTQLSTTVGIYRDDWLQAVDFVGRQDTFNVVCTAGAFVLRGKQKYFLCLYI